MSTETLPSAIDLYVDSMIAHINANRFTSATDLAMSTEDTFEQADDITDGLLLDARFYAAAIVAALLANSRYHASALYWGARLHTCTGYSPETIPTFVSKLSPEIQRMYNGLMEG